MKNTCLYRNATATIAPTLPPQVGLIPSLLQYLGCDTYIGNNKHYPMAFNTNISRCTFAMGAVFFYQNNKKKKGKKSSFTCMPLYFGKRRKNLILSSLNVKKPDKKAMPRVRVDSKKLAKNLIFFYRYIHY